MDEQEDYQEDSKQQGSFLQKTFNFVKSIPKFILFEKRPNQVNSAPQDDEYWKKEIQRKWSIIDKSSIHFSSQSKEQGEKEEEEEAAAAGSSDQDQVQMVRTKLQDLKLAFEKVEAEKQKLESQNTIMRQQLEQWMKSPIKMRRYARIQGKLCFDRDCDEVKVEKDSSLYEQEDNP